MRGAAIALFRKPIDRIISAYLFGEGLMLPLGCDLKIKELVFKARIELQRNSSYKFPITRYVGLDGMSNCQTKMILGYKVIE
jgi:hypothetical protein